jgi:hypothetical protein
VVEEVVSTVLAAATNSTVEANVANASESRFYPETGANILRHWRLFCEFLLEREGLSILTSKNAAKLVWKKTSRRKKTPEEHLSSIIVDPEGRAFAEYLCSRSKKVSAATIRTETTSLRACLRILRAAGMTEFKPESLLNPALQLDHSKAVPLTEEMISNCFGLQSLQLAARRDIGVFVSFVRQHVTPQASWKQELAASRRLRSVKRIATFRRLADDSKVISTVTGQLVFCSSEWIDAFLGHLVPCSKCRQVVVAIRQFYRWLEKEQLCEFDSTSLAVPESLRSTRVLMRPVCFRSGYLVKDLTVSSSEAEVEETRREAKSEKVKKTPARRSKKSLD